jgi:PAS domain S-box-containing protein
MGGSGLANITVTRDGIVMHWNKAAESLFGYTAAEMIGRPIAILGSCSRRQKVDAIRRVREGDSVHDIETVRVGKDGRSVNVVLTVVPIKSEGGTVIGMNAIVVEATGKRT